MTFLSSDGKAITGPYLHPEEKQVRGTYQPKSPIPPELREFGKFPNTHQWLPGDVLLFGEATPGFVGKTIRKVQVDCGFAITEARWQHAALYIGNDYMVEAAFPKVRFHPIFDDVMNRCILVRRMPDLPLQKRHEIAVAALTKLGTWYGWPELLQVFALRGRMWIKPKKVNRRTFSRICSQLVAHSYATATGKVLCVDAGFERATTPADLALTRQLDDVPVYWQEIHK